MKRKAICISHLQYHITTEHLIPTIITSTYSHSSTTFRIPLLFQLCASEFFLFSSLPDKLKLDRITVAITRTYARFREGLDVKREQERESWNESGTKIEVVTVQYVRGSHALHLRSGNLRLFVPSIPERYQSTWLMKFINAFVLNGWGTKFGTIKWVEVKILNDEM